MRPMNLDEVDVDEPDLVEGSVYDVFLSQEAIEAELRRRATARRVGF